MGKTRDYVKKLRDTKAETPVLWLPHAKSWLIGKDSDAGRDWGQEEAGTTEDEMAGWHHWLDGRESEWTPGVGDGQGGLACCDSWGRKELDTTERLNWTDVSYCGYVLLKEVYLHLSCTELMAAFLWINCCSYQRFCPASVQHVLPNLDLLSQFDELGNLMSMHWALPKESHTLVLCCRVLSCTL